MKKLAYGLLLVWLCMAVAHAKTIEYDLVIAKQKLSVLSGTQEKITVNGSIPGPVLSFSEGDLAIIRVTNRMNEVTSVHWHGLLLPNGMDGVPGQGGFMGIKAGQTFTYHFPIRQNGTYWYHAHSKGQEQDGLYGAIVITPRTPDVKVQHDYVMLLSDYSRESSSEILSHLKMSSDYYQYSRRTLADFWRDVGKKGFSATLDQAKAWGEMRMQATDLSDVSQYTFLLNGQTPEQNWTGLAQAGELVRLRLINGSAMTLFDVRIPHIKMRVIAADGQPVEPIDVDELRFGPGETYDLLIRMPDEQAYRVVAEPIDRTGFALGTLAPRLGMPAEMPKQRERSLLTMQDMGHGNQTMSMQHGQEQPEMDMPHEHGGHDAHGQHGASQQQASGWANHHAPEGTVILNYQDLRFAGQQQQNAPAQKEILLTLDGNMQRYIWMINGKKFSESEPIRLHYGERVKLTFINQTMMAHPMHLHGMFVQLENGQAANKRPNKHTIIVPPAGRSSVFLSANELGEWVMHCHLLYHMASGMMTSVVVSAAEHTPPSPPATSMDMPTPSATVNEEPQHEHHH